MKYVHMKTFFFHVMFHFRTDLLPLNDNGQQNVNIVKRYTYITDRCNKPKSMA